MKSKFAEAVRSLLKFWHFRQTPPTKKHMDSIALAWNDLGLCSASYIDGFSGCGADVAQSQRHEAANLDVQSPKLVKHFSVLYESYVSC